MSETKVTSQEIDYATLYASAGSSYVATNQTTTSTSWTSLATAQSVTVDVTASGKVLVGIVAGDVYNSLIHNQSKISFAYSGANTGAAGITRQTQYQAYANNGAGSASGVFLLDSLTPGSTTFTMQFSVSGGTGGFGYRTIWVLPL